MHKFCLVFIQTVYIPPNVGQYKFSVFELLGIPVPNKSSYIHRTYAWNAIQTSFRKFLALHVPGETLGVPGACFLCSPLFSTRACQILLKIYFSWKLISPKNNSSDYRVYGTQNNRLEPTISRQKSVLKICTASWDIAKKVRKFWHFAWKTKFGYIFANISGLPSYVCVKTVGSSRSFRVP